MPDLVIRFKKNRDGSAGLTCIRSDGTSTWQRQEGKLGAVFPPHDLTHYAVETALGYARGFYGLIADGWEISDFASPWPKGQPGEEARQVEMVVSFFDMDRTQGATATVWDFNARAASYADSRSGDPRSPKLRLLTEDEITAVRTLRSRLLERWRGVPPGGTLELNFDRRSSLNPPT